MVKQIRHIKTYGKLGLKSIAKKQAQLFSIALIDLGHGSEMIKLENGYRIMTEEETECKFVDFLTD